MGQFGAHLDPILDPVYGSSDGRHGGAVSSIAVRELAEKPVKTTGRSGCREQTLVSRRFVFDPGRSVRTYGPGHGLRTVM